MADAKATAAEAPPYAPEDEERALLERAERACELALAGGAEEAEAYAGRASEIEVALENGDVQLASVRDSRGLGLRVFRERRIGFTYSNLGTDEALERMARDAVELASAAPADEHNVLPRPASAAELSRPVTAAPALCAFDVERATDEAATFLRALTGTDERVSVDNGSFSVARGSSAIVSSAGARASESDAVASWMAFGMAVDGDDVGGFDFRSDAVRDLGELAPRRDALAAEFVDAVLGNLGAGSAESYRGRVLLAPEAFAAICLSPLLSAASALAVQRGRSFLAGRVGERIAGEVLRLADDPSDVELAGAGAFDREGVPRRPFAIVEDGVLRSLLHNTYTASVDETSSTGHATGGARGLPGIGSRCLSVAAGSGGTPDDLRSALARGLQVGRFSGTVDPASGDFSGVAKSARWVEAGHAVRAVGETLVAGNAFELLRGALELGSTSALISGAARVPWAIVDGVSVTAG